MRVGDFSVEIVPTDGEGVRETASGHVLARPGQVYALRLRNHGPLRAVADVSIDGHPVTGGGLVIAAGSTVNLERPIHATERGRFTVIAEGDEQVFGPDGGRDNADLGLIEARFRRELPQPDSRSDRRVSDYPSGSPRPLVTPPSPTPEQSPGMPSRRPMAPPEWTPPGWLAASGTLRGPLGGSDRRQRGEIGAISALMAPTVPAEAPPAQTHVGDSIERAAGTGLTGSSEQDFVSVHVGQLEAEATVIQLRLVIGTSDALTSPRPLPGAEPVPARPAPRP